MAVKKKTVSTPRKKYPARIVIVDQWNRSENCRSVADAITKASNKMNRENNYPPELMGVYRLVKVVRRQRTPVEIEDIVMDDVK